jgi:hypothetical protein
MDLLDFLFLFCPWRLALCDAPANDLVGNQTLNGRMPSGLLPFCFGMAVVVPFEGRVWRLFFVVFFGLAKGRLWETCRKNVVKWSGSVRLVYVAVLAWFMWSI